MNAATALDNIQQWPFEEQLDLLFRLWDRIIDAGWVPGPDPELLTELQQRLARHDADPTRVLTWDQVLSHIRRVR